MHQTKLRHTPLCPAEGRADSQLTLLLSEPDRLARALQESGVEGDRKVLLAVTDALTSSGGSSLTAGPACLSGRPMGGGDPKGDCMGWTASTSSLSSSRMRSACAWLAFCAESRLTLLDRELAGGRGLYRSLWWGIGYRS